MTCLEAAFDVHEAALMQVLPRELREFPVADVPGDDVVIVGVFLLFAVRALAVAIGGYGKAGHGRPARRIAHLRITRQATDKHHFVQVHLFPSSCRTSKCRKTVSEIFKTRSTSVTFA